MGLAIRILDVPVNGERLSVPFSSGWALRFADNLELTDNLAVFQFPFHRDGPCDGNVGFCISCGINLSVPFSSGWALRSNRMATDGARMVPFSSLFIGMGLAIPIGWQKAVRSSWLSVPFSSGWALRSIFSVIDEKNEFPFQFPFHRDGPCDYAA